MQVKLNIGDAVTLLSAVGYALQVVLAAKYVKNCSPAGLAFVQIAVVAVLSFAPMVAFEGVPAVFPVPALAAIAFLAIFASIFAEWVQMGAQREIDPSRVSLILLAEPLFAALFGFLLLGETLDMAQWLGAMLMLAGMFWAGN